MSRRYVIKLGNGNAPVYYAGYNVTTLDKNNAILLTVKDARITIKVSCFSGATIV